MIGGVLLDAQSVVFGAFQAGQAVNNLQVVYLDGQYWKPSDPVTTGKGVPPQGIAIQSAASGAIVQVMSLGIVSNSAWALASGQPAFLGSGGGVIASSPTGSGNWVARVGIAQLGTVLLFNPEISPFQIGQ